MRRLRSFRPVVEPLEPRRLLASVTDPNVLGPAQVVNASSINSNAAFAAANVVSGTKAAFLFGDGSSPQRLAISNFDAAINTLRFFDTPSYLDRAASAVTIYYSSVKQLSLLPANYIDLGTFSLPTTNLGGTAQGDVYETATSPPDYPRATDPGANPAAIIHYDELTGLDIPVGTQSILLDFGVNAAGIGFGFTEIEALGVASLPRPANATLLGWGQNVYQKFNASLQVAGSNLYAETASLGGTQSGGDSGFAYVWPEATMFRVLDDLVRYDPATYTPIMRAFSDELYTRYWENTAPGGYRSGVSSGATIFYDDNAHVAVALAEAYNLTGDPVYLSRAIQTYQFILTGEDSAGGGGIYFSVPDHSEKNAISTLQEVRAGLLLYELTGQASYLNDATRLYTWAATHIQESEGLFYQEYALTGANADTPQGIELINGAGIGLSCNLLFYNVTGNVSYLHEAQLIGTTSIPRYFNSAGAINDEGFWDFELVDALNALYLDDRNPAWLNDVTGALTWLHANREDPNGHYGTLWARDNYTPGTIRTSWNMIDQAAVAESYLRTAEVDYPVPTITTTPANWTVNQPGYSQTMQTKGGTGSITFALTGGTLPPGIGFSSSGVLSGTPIAIGSFSFTVTATDATGAMALASYTVTINPPPTIVTTTLPSGTVNEPLYYQGISLTAGTAPYAFSATGSLPPGLTLTSTGVLFGTPTSAGSFTFTVTATDHALTMTSQTYTVIIYPPVSITTTSLANWTVNQAGYAQTITTAGGMGTDVFSQATGTLPTGLSLSSSGVLAGTPTAPGVYEFRVTATDGNGSSSSQSYTVVINPAVMITTTPPDGDMGTAYSQTITASGTGTKTFALTAGTLPAGLLLNSSGVLSGTPTMTGSFTFTITATDAVGAAGSQAFTVIIHPAVTLATAPLASGDVGTAYDQTINASDGNGSYKFSQAGGTLPSGLTLSGGGILSGTPTAAGSYLLEVIATDTLGGSASQSFTVVINPAVSIATMTLTSWVQNQAGYSQTISADGGTGPLIFGVSGTLPAGLTMSSSGVLSGTPTTAGSYTFTVTATDAVGGTAGQSYTLTIHPVVTLNPGVLPSGLLNAAYNQTITALGGTGTVTLVVSNLAAAIPGLNVPSGATGTLAITGTPTATGTETFTVTATDTLGVTTSTNYSITVNPTTVYLNLPSSGFVASPGGMVMSFPISINELQDQASTNHVGLASASLALTFPTGVFNFSLGSNNASADVSLGSVPLSDTVSPGGAADWNLTATSPGDGQLNITLTAKAGKSITTDNPATGGSLVTINFPVSATYNPASPTAVPITVVSANGSFHTAITGSNGGYGLKPAPPYAGSVTINASGAGAFSQYLVAFAGSGTVQAGSGFLVAVQAADASSNPVTNYSGPSTVTVTISPTSAGSSVPATVAINSNGLGFFLATVQKAGSYTISVASGSYVGTSNPVTVTPGPAVKLGFAATPADTPTGDVLAAVSVQAQDLYGNVVTSDNTDPVTIGVDSGPGVFTSTSMLTSPVHNGVATFSNLTLVNPGTYQLSAVVPGLYTGPYSASFSVLPLQVVPGSFVGTPTGFSLQLNAPMLLDSLTPAQYGSGSGATATVSPTVTLTQTTGTPPAGATLPYQVPGSLIVDQTTNTFTFVETDTASVVAGGTPLLPDGVYVVDITSSGANGLQALNSGGGYVDGTNSGSPGHDFTATFTVGAAAAGDDVLWVPATADGPGQPLEAPGKNQVGSGYPIYLSDSTGMVSSVQATLTYNPALLTVTPSSTSTFTVMVPSPGTAVLQYNGPPLPAGLQTPIGYLTAMVPAGTAGTPTPYKAKDLLHLSGVALNGGAIPVVAAGALHLVAYVGDADGNGAYSSSDAVLITRALLQTDTGFVAYPLVDPVVIADTDGAGFIPADAALQANEAGVGFPTANLPIPPIPSGVVFQPIANNVDPTIYIPTNLHVGANGTVTVPLRIDDAHPAGSAGLIRGHLALTYDPHQFTVSAANVHPGSLLAGGGWSIVPTIDPATGQIAIALAGDTPITSTLGGSLVTIDFHTVGGNANPSSIALVPSVTPNGQFITTELEDAQGAFTLSQGNSVVMVTGSATVLPTTAARGMVNDSATPTVEPSSDLHEVAPAVVETARGAAEVIAEPGDPESSTILMPIVEAAPLHVGAAPVHGIAAIVAATSSSLATGPMTGLVFQFAGTPLAVVPANTGLVWQNLADQLFQVLARTTSSVSDSALVGAVQSLEHDQAGQLFLAQPSSEDVDSFNWDTAGSDLDWQGAARQPLSSTREHSEFSRRLTTPAAETVTSHAVLDQVFSQYADDTDLQGDGE